jgi:hypothetical protein
MRLFNRSGPIDFLKSQHGFEFTRLHAHIVEEEGAFSVRVRMLNVWTWGNPLGAKK